MPTRLHAPGTESYVSVRNAATAVRKETLPVPGSAQRRLADPAEDGRTAASVEIERLPGGLRRAAAGQPDITLRLSFFDQIDNDRVRGDSRR